MLKNAGSLVCYVYILFNLALSWSPLLFLHSIRSFSLSFPFSRGNFAIFLCHTLHIRYPSFVRARVYSLSLSLSLSLSIIFENFIHTRAGTILLFFSCMCLFIFGFRRFITQTIIVWNIYCCQCMTRYDIHSNKCSFVRLVDSLFLYVLVSCDVCVRVYFFVLFYLFVRPLIRRKYHLSLCMCILLLLLFILSND